MKGETFDPKGVIRESYLIEGIEAAECRSIFLDWALSLPDGLEAREVLPKVIAKYGEHHPEHPMTQVLQAGLVQMQAPRRRGGWRSRPRN